MSLSRASTMTLGQDNVPNHHLQHEEEDAMSNHINVDLLDQIGSEPSEKRLIIAVDFGTTYSSVSYVEIPEGCPSDSVDARSICSITSYPDSLDFNANDNMLMEVPSEVIYPLNRHFREQDSLIRSQEGLETASNDSEEQETHHDAPNNGVQDMDIYDDDGDTTMNVDVADQFHWGYRVHELWALPATHSDPSNLPLSRFKLLLDNSPMTERVRQDLNPTLNMLKSRKVVHGPLHVIADYLTYLLDHTQSQLRQLGYEDSCPKEMVLCVPAIWTQQACRDMQKCLAVAMKRANFKGVDVQNNSIENLFIVSEPEAAAAHMLANSTQIRCGQSFVLLDAGTTILGGGTVDANTYRVSIEEPLRLEHEIVPPGGGLHGSSYLNEDLKAYLLRLLAEETYLEQGSETINGIVERVMIEQFEPKIKRNFDCYQRSTTKQLAISGLRDNPDKGFRRGIVEMSTTIIKGIFMKHLHSIFEIVKRQLDEALSNGCEVENVVLIGGFGFSISLVKFLEKSLAEYSRQNNCHVKLLKPKDRNNVANAVSLGAVLRAMNKNHGPERRARSSYGILRAEPFKEYPEH
ncbi:hypothetical protein FOPG_12760 [Fusarium oxysporum f. sp. conglutinans race 2 54008]|uniref:Hsp70 protein n=1 Tax=Fusarium oxysporum f. sp. conglutinans race 2 54008 TaxID=1089457 RepID=X0HIN1_FUSOX|nr:hypothetical protein FOPG_12760 [Fusarium oxysporum f. sp. conglutinans race 2 54008]